MSSINNYTATYLSDHYDGLSHAGVTRFLKDKQLRPFLLGFRRVLIPIAFQKKNPLEQLIYFFSVRTSSGIACEFVLPLS